MTHAEFKKTLRLLIVGMMRRPKKWLTSYGDLAWNTEDLVVTSTTARKLSDKYDELDGWRFYNKNDVDFDNFHELFGETK